MELAILHCTPLSDSPEAELDLPAPILRLLEGVERSLESPNSRRAYRTSLLHFFGWCRAQSNVQTFSRMAVLQYKDSLIAAGDYLEDGRLERRYAPATVNQRLAAVRALAQEAADQSLISPTEAAGIRRVRGDKSQSTRTGMWVGKAELDRILCVPDRKTLRGKRDFAMLAVLFSTGLRRNELVGLPVAALKQRDGQWGLIDLVGKGGKLRSVPLPLWVKAAIYDWLNATHIVQGFMFRSISRHGKLGTVQMSDESVKLILSHYTTLENLEDFRPHDARRTCARLLRASDAALEDIKELLGHSSIQTTERYLGKPDSFRRAITNAITEPSHTI
jgi:site-specific recombinase XerD